jgi:predicted DNA-binding ribbon-helix-helix protein
MNTNPSKNLKRSVMLAGKPTSVSLEREFWVALKELAEEASIPVNELINRIDGARGAPNLSSALRIFVIEQFRRKALEAGQLAGKATTPSAAASGEGK